MSKKEQMERDAEIGKAVSMILGRSKILKIKHYYEENLAQVMTIASCTVTYEKNGSVKTKSGDTGPREVLNCVAEDIKDGKGMGRLTVPR